MGAANSVRKLTVDSIALLEQLEPDTMEVQRKREVREYVQHALEQEWPACRVLPFGSSESGIGFGGSDVDLGIYFEDMDVDHQDHFSMQERIQILTTAHARLIGAFEVKEFIRNARVPVLKLWDPKRQVACDVCVGGINAILNTALIKHYGQADPRVRPLAFAVKYWAQQRGINDSVNGTLSSYGFSLLLIFYLQSRHSPILVPSVHSIFQSLQNEKNLGVLLQRLHSIPSTDLQSTFGTSFQDSVGALLAGFFQFYACQFNVEDDVVSIRTGVPLSKTTKWSHPVPWRISIEDPFELAHDVGRVIFNRKGQELLNFEFQRAFDMVCIGHRLDEICAPDATSWNIVARCYICEGSDHKARECMKLQLRMDHVARGGQQHATMASFLTECWYCGECGHFKAACPMLSFRNIPLHGDVVMAAPVPQIQVQQQHSELPPARSQPIPIGQSTTQKTLFGRHQEWERGYSVPSPPRSSKKKKRPRQGSSPALSPVMSPPTTAPPALLLSPSLLPEKHPKRRQQQQQQQQEHQRFTLVPAAPRMCGTGKKWGSSNKPRKIDVSSIDESVESNMSAMVSAQDASAADFLRRLSVADAKVLLDRTRKEKESKTKEMQKMIGVRYRDLIESADKIVNMHSAALRLEGSLKEMPDKWKRVEKTLTTTLAEASQMASSSPSEDATRHEDSVALASNGASSASELMLSAGGASVHDQVQFLVAVPEEMWQLLDRGESFRALRLYLAAKDVYSSVEFQKHTRKFPFVPSAWSCIQNFQPNLCTLAVLSEPSVSVDQLFKNFLESRSKWMEPSQSGASSSSSTRGPERPKSFTQQERHLAVVLRSINLTLLQTEEIFNAEAKFSAFESAFQLKPALQGQLEQFVSSGTLERKMAEWFLAQHKKIEAQVSSTISQISSIGLLSKVQSKLSNANQIDGDCARSKIWPIISSAMPHAKRSLQDDSPFSTLFAEAFRKRTRDLVQHSFVEALEAIKKQIREVVGESVGGGEHSRLVTRLGCVKFYDYFEIIHKKAADLDASDLQGVLVEEFLRTLLKLVMFFENEFPLQTGAKNNDPSSAVSIMEESKYLCISNILSVLLAGFPERSAKLFPNMASASPTEERKGFLRARAVFEDDANDGSMSKSALSAALQKLCQQNESSLPCFIDEELSALHKLGPHSFYLVSEIKQRAAYPQTFVNVVRELSREYCELWARSHLNRKIEPLRERIRMEQYESSNEEWIKSHEGWVEQLITEDSLGSDLDDSASETEAFGEEKVWLPWCETTTVSSFLFQCCYMLDEANRLVRNSDGADEKQVKLMHQTIRDVIVDQLTIISVEAYEDGVSLLVRAKTNQKQTALNFGECCIQQFLFDMYFVRATLGFSDFIRFGWGDELNPEECSPGLLKLKQLFEKMQDFIDPVDWEIYGPQLIENVVIQFRKSRLLFSSLSESNDINEINGKQVSVSAHDTRLLVRIAEPVARFSLLPVPSTRRLQRKQSPTPGRLAETGQDAAMGKNGQPSAAKSVNLFQEQQRVSAENSSASLKLQNILSGTAAGSNILSAAASGTNLLSSAAKGMSYLSSATSSYLREGESRPKSYF